MFTRHLLSSVAHAPLDRSAAADGRTPVTDILDDFDVDPPARQAAGDVDPPRDPEDDEDDADDPEDDETEDELELLRARQPQSRNARRISTLANENKALKDQLTSAMSRFDRLEQRLTPQPAQQQQESPEVEGARLALMTPEERQEHKLNRALANNTRQTQAVLQHMQNTTDSDQFTGYLERNPRFKQFKAEVEAEAGKLREAGNPLPRMGILRFIIGNKVLERQDAGTKPARRSDAERRVRNEEVQPERRPGRSDVRGGDRRNQGARPNAAANRLANVSI